MALTIKQRELAKDFFISKITEINTQGIAESEIQAILDELVNLVETPKLVLLPYADEKLTQEATVKPNIDAQALEAKKQSDKRLAALQAVKAELGK